jgi:hypothetical protein
MKSFKIYFSQAALISICAFSGCQTDELGSLSPATSRTPEGTAELNLPDDKTIYTPLHIPPSSVVKQVYPQATSWLVTWNNVKDDYYNSIAGVFSTVDGSFHSFYSLSQAATETIANADMSLVNHRFIRNLTNGHTYSEFAPATLFKPSTLSPLEFAVAVQNNPSLFQQEFENSPFVPTGHQPYPTQESGLVVYGTGQIYLFKTDRTPAVYGAIRIVNGDINSAIPGPWPRVIQIVVYKPLVKTLP